MILEKALNSTLPANINLGTVDGRELYIAYRRDPKEPPITGLAVVCPALGDEIPDGFTKIETTPAGLSASINAGTKGPETFLCFTKQQGQPITGIAILNNKKPTLYDENIYTRLDVTPSGKLANLNGGTKGDPIFICYRGGCKSFFGYPKGK